MSQPPTGTVTFLFTDIDGSTERWERQREAIQAALPSKATSPRYSGPFSTHAATSSSKATDGPPPRTRISKCCGHQSSSLRAAYQE